MRFFSIAVRISGQNFRIQNDEQNFKELINMKDLYEAR